MNDKGIHVEEVNLDQTAPEPIQRLAIEKEAENARKGRRTGLFVIVLGLILTVIGATGTVDLHLEGMGLKAEVANATPGVVLMLVGLVIVWRTNLKIKIARRQ